MSEDRSQTSTTTLLQELQASNLVARESLRAMLWQLEDALSATARIDAAIARLAERLPAPLVVTRRGTCGRVEVSR